MCRRGRRGYRDIRPKLLLIGLAEAILDLNGEEVLALGKRAGGCDVGNEIAIVIGHVDRQIRGSPTRDERDRESRVVVFGVGDRAEGVRARLAGDHADFAAKHRDRRAGVDHDLARVIEQPHHVAGTQWCAKPTTTPEKQLIADLPASI